MVRTRREQIELDWLERDDSRDRDDVLFLLAEGDSMQEDHEDDLRRIQFDLESAQEEAESYRQENTRLRERIARLEDRRS